MEEDTVIVGFFGGVFGFVSVRIVSWCWIPLQPKWKTQIRNGNEPRNNTYRDFTKVNQYQTHNNNISADIYTCTYWINCIIRNQ